MGQINSANHGRQRQEPNTLGNANAVNAEGSANSEAIHELIESSPVPPNNETARQDNVTEKQSRWESARKSLIRSNNSGSSRDKQGGSVNSEDKKRWRVSRRWSKVPAKAHFDPTDNTSDGTPTNQGTEATEARSGAHDLYLAQDVNESVEHRDQRESLSVLASPENASTAGPSSLSVTGLSSSEKHLLDAEEGNLDTLETDVNSGTPEHTIERQVVSEPPAILIDGSPVVLESHDETTSDGSAGNSGSDQASSSNDRRRDLQPSHEEPALRQFSPGRTLVVVQGVVHTTGTPRTPEQPSTSPPSESPRASPELETTARAPSHRDSLLSNLHRRNSGTSSRSRRSIVNPDTLDSSVSEMNDGNSTGEVNSNSTPETSADPSSSSGSIPPETSASTNSLDPSSGNHNMPRRPPQVNSSSVDVLGALLSVATAATAASLLSASPQRRSALQHAAMPQPGVTSNPGVGSPQVMAPGNASPIPALARALATANPVAAAAIAQREREREREENEGTGTRNLWENMRERIMRVRNRTQSDQAGTARTGHENGSAPAHGGNSAIPDTLFSTLARAFSFDQSQDEEQSISQPINGSELRQGGSSPSHGGQRGVDQESSTMDSFEQFLVDLQTDVRTVLLELETTTSSTTTESIPTSVSGSSSANGSAPNDGPTIIHGNDSNVALPLQHDSVDGSRSEIDDSPPVVVEPTILETVGNATLVQNSLAGTSTTPAATDVADVSSSSSLSSPVDSAELGENAQIPSRSRVSQQSSQTLQPTMPNPGLSPTVHGRGINWWRMYRFPPMRMNSTRQNMQAATTGTNGTIPSSVTSTAHSTEGASTLPENATTAEPSFSASFSPDSLRPTAPIDTDISHSPQATDNNLVVPVIVVGLQSINVPARASRPTEEAQPALGSRLPNGGQSTQEVPDSMDANVSVENNEARRGRNWHSRATRLLSRMGRRNTIPDQDLDISQEVASSRTYFIYVIGGYYPPDHHIVTGSDLLDSFEALWDLADLLGQVKPPIATEEEVRGSGLEVIKASSLQEFENANKIAGNCVERCLICLDDYEPEDDIRLLSCKHAFHKSCVDHWLTTGRNNCPACRSKGVPTHDEHPAQSST